MSGTTRMHHHGSHHHGSHHHGSHHHGSHFHGSHFHGKVAARRRGRALLAALAIGLAGSALGSSACSSDHAEIVVAGRLSLALEASADDGTRYRLENATFRVRGPMDVDLGTSDAEDLGVNLEPGAYGVELAPGFRLVRVDDGGEVSATLQSDNPTTVLISALERTTAEFVFLVDEESVPFGDGVLDIGLTVIEADASGACVPGEVRCDGLERQVCNGEAFSTESTCATACVGGTCVEGLPPVCVLNESRLGQCRLSDA